MSGDAQLAAAAAAESARAADEKAPAAAAATAAAEADGGAPAAAAADADGDDGAVVKRKRNRLKAVGDDAPAAAAAAAAPAAGAPAAAAAAASSSSSGDLEAQFRAAIEKYLETANVESTTLGDVRKHLKTLMPSDVVSANKALVNKLMEQIMVAKLQANVISSGADASEIASAAAAASAAADAGGSQPAEDEPEPSDDDDGADASAGSDEDYDGGKKSKKKDKTEKKSSKKKLRKAADSDDEGSKKRSGAKRKKGGGPEPPKKPKSAFIFFSTANRKKAKEDHEGASFGQLGKILGDRWKVLSDAEKATFEDQATEDKRRYEKEMDEFKLANPDYEGPSRKSRKRNDDDDVTAGDLDGIEGIGGSGGGGSSKSSGRSSSITKPPGPDASFYDHVLFQLKLQKRKKKDKHSDDEVKDFAQKMVAKMDAAYDDDTASVKAGQPGLKKLQLLPEVTANVSKVMLEEALRDKGILRSFTKWLTPLSDGSLPNLKLRTELYMLLGKLKVEESDLANSDGLGKLMMRLWDHKQETVANKKQLQSLIEKWTRPIFGATVDYKKLAEVERKKAKEIIARKQSLGYKPVIPAPAVTKRAIIPDAATFDYALRPDSMLDEEEAEERAPKKDNESKHARLAKKIDPRTLGRTKSMRQATVDVTGNHINA